MIVFDTSVILAVFGQMAQPRSETEPPRPMEAALGMIGAGVASCSGPAIIESFCMTQMAPNGNACFQKKQELSSTLPHWETKYFPQTTAPEQPNPQFAEGHKL